MPSLASRTQPLPTNEYGVRRLEFRALGTQCLVLFRQQDERAALTFAAEALDWIGKFEAKFSRYREDSLISKINQAAGKEWVAIDTETEQILDLADQLFHVTSGVLDPTMLPLLRVWDWKTVHLQLPSGEEIKTALSLTGWQKVQRKKGFIHLPKPGMGLDLGGFGKEFAVDRLVHIARAHGLKDFLIDLGRDVFASGGNGQHPFWHVGLESGKQPGNCWGGLAVDGFAVCTSGDYARHFVHDGMRYGHILDPRTGWPVANGVHAVTAIAPHCLQAGIYSTAVCILGPIDGLALTQRARGVEICVQSDHGYQATPGFTKKQVQAA
jgi:FAD:protein FMN transferase